MRWLMSTGEVSFVPSLPPSMPPAELEIRLPRANPSRTFDLPMRTFTGKLSTGGHALTPASIAVWSLFDEPHGLLRLLPDTCYAKADASGSYRVIVPRMPRYRAVIRSPEVRFGYPPQEWVPTTDDAVEARDFDL